MLSFNLINFYIKLNEIVLLKYFIYFYLGANFGFTFKVSFHQNIIEKFYNFILSCGFFIYKK